MHTNPNPSMISQYLISLHLAAVLPIGKRSCRTIRRLILGRLGWGGRIVELSKRRPHTYLLDCYIHGHILHCLSTVHFCPRPTNITDCSFLVLLTIGPSIRPKALQCVGRTLNRQRDAYQLVRQCETLRHFIPERWSFTLSPKRVLADFGYNFVKCQSIFKIASLLNKN